MQALYKSAREFMEMEMALFGEDYAAKAESQKSRIHGFARNISTMDRDTTDAMHTMRLLQSCSCLDWGVRDCRSCDVRVFRCVVRGPMRCLSRGRVRACSLPRASDETCDRLCSLSPNSLLPRHFRRALPVEQRDCVVR